MKPLTSNLPIASHNKSSFDVILVNISTITILNDNSTKLLLNLVKPKGKVAFSSMKDDQLESMLLLNGFVNVKYEPIGNCKNVLKSSLWLIKCKNIFRCRRRKTKLRSWFKREAFVWQKARSSNQQGLEVRRR